MTIELVTGNPGSGKSTYAVAVRLVAELGREIKLEPEACAGMGLEPGSLLKRRIVVAGVNGLLVEHQRLPHTLTGERQSQQEIDFWNRLDDEGEPVHKRLPGQAAWNAEAFDAARVEAGPRVPSEWFRPSLFNWWLWAMPGDLIFVDEIQFIVPRGTLGKKPAHWIALLEIHRHFGIDLLFVTQHPQLLDTTIRALVGVHRHVRPVMGSPVCMVFTWDHASNPERYNLASKAMWRRKRAHYRLFRSSSAHIAPPTAGRKVAALILPLVLVVVAGVWYFKGRFAAPVATAVAAQAAPQAGTRGQAVPPGVPASAAQAADVRGCYSQGERCACQDATGRPLRLPLEVCRQAASTFDGLVAWRPQEGPRQTNYGAAGGASHRPSLGASSPAGSGERSSLF